MTHKDLNVWKDSIKLVVDLYRITRKFPKDEIFGITSQIKRAAVSIPANISEGSGRIHSKEYVRFLGISRGSASELETLIQISYELEYLNETEYCNFTERVTKIIVQLTKLMQSIINKSAKA